MDGFKELDNALKKLPSGVARAQLRAASRRSMKPVQREAKQRLASSSWKSEKAAASVKVMTLKNTRLPSVVAVSTDSDNWIAALYEYGFHTRPYGNPNAPLVYRPPESWLRPAWDANIKRVESNFGDELWYVLQRLAARLQKQAAAGKLSRTGARTLAGF